VERLDHLAFPWFWWNVGAEFDSYMRIPGVEVWIGIHDERVVSYLGITHYRGWGHLDRIATHPDSQRGGIGAASLETAIRLLRVHGARRIALSTQGENLPAQRMYERRGFERTPVHDYTVYGIILDKDRFGPPHKPGGTTTMEAARGARIRREDINEQD
jgi:ribosomal protein S18 acetylase RimI-like enzyme